LFLCSVNQSVNVCYLKHEFFIYLWITLKTGDKKMKFKSTELILPLIVALLAFTGGLFAGFVTFEEESISISNKQKNTTNNTESTTLDDNGIKINENKTYGSDNNNNLSVYLSVDYQNGTVNHYNFSTSADNVYEVLIDAAEKFDFKVEATYYGQYGSYFVEQIGSKTNDEKNRYWAYYLNDNYGSTGANLQKIKNNDEIKWCFELSQF
jgi:hypothetical protein